MENIVPSINTTQKPLKELSPQEFQQMLSRWFEEKGLVQDLKSYLKFQMINILKSTSLGKNIHKTSYPSCTLAQQALHLIVAEYLLHYQCNFSLSLFSSEVNLANMLPGMTIYAQETIFHKFDKENLLNILELLSIDKEHFPKILYQYFEQGNALLVSLLNIIGVKEENFENYQEEMNFEDDFIKHIYLTVQSLNLPQKTQKQLLYNLKACYELKNKSYQNQVVQLIDKFQKEFDYRDQKLHRNQKHKKMLEKKIAKLKEKYQLLLENEVSANQQCLLNHCNEECNNLKQINELHKKEIEKLKNINNKQKEEIERLQKHCNELVMEFNSCQNKISLVNARLDEENDKINLENDSFSSEDITEKILQEARQKLKLLEEESEELDIKFNNKFVK